MLTNGMQSNARMPRALCVFAMLAVASAIVATRPADAGAQILKKIKDKAAQMAGAGSAADSVKAKADSTAKGGSKISQAASKLTAATDAIQQKTGVSKQAIVGAAVAASGAGLVGAALQGGSPCDNTSAGLSAAKAVIGAVKDAKDMNRRGADAAAGGDVRGDAMETSLQQHLQWLEAAANDSTQPPTVRLVLKQQLELYRLSLRAQQGDTAAMRALTAAAGSKLPRKP